MTTQLYAAIRKDSKYFHQNPPQESLPFPVAIVDTTDAYRVRGNGDFYRLEDVYLFVKADCKFRPINRTSELPTQLDRNDIGGNDQELTVAVELGNN
ncbi:hypothetical protein [Microbulbifer discodermiae]|uniref:hypothetical protein n=1 Tax=Microbulbifer sp. 2201CG32-9 TaxID=3232309 RepID=UPI00345BB663